MKLKNERLVFKMALLGLCLALYFALNFVSVDLRFIKLSVKYLPIIFTCALFGPVEGMLVALFGEFFCQLTSQYGLGPTTPLWLIPPVLFALIVGLIFKHKDVRTHLKLWIFTVVLACVILTAVNTVFMLVDAKIMGYSQQFTFVMIILRFVSSILSAALYIFLVPLALFEPLIKLGKIELIEQRPDTKENQK